MRIHRLNELRDAMLECGEFLDEFHSCFPEITAERR